MTKTFRKATQGLENNKYSSHDASSSTDLMLAASNEPSAVDWETAGTTSELGQYFLILYFHRFFACTPTN
jgi:hypothetical protein